MKGLVVFEIDGDPHLLLGQSPLADEKVPPHLDGTLLKISPRRNCRASQKVWCRAVIPTFRDRYVLLHEYIFEVVARCNHGLFIEKTLNRTISIREGRWVVRTINSSAQSGGLAYETVEKTSNSPRSLLNPLLLSHSIQLSVFQTLPFVSISSLLSVTSKSSRVVYFCKMPFTKAKSSD
jgi:hypothetical protein